MLTDPKLRSQVDALWDKFWTGGLANPLDAIEQFSYQVTVPKVLWSVPQSVPKVFYGRLDFSGQAFGTISQTFGTFSR